MEKQLGGKKIKSVGSRRQVMSGSAVKTKGGLKKKDLKKKDGRIISIEKSKNATKNKALSDWRNAMKKARKDLGITDFVLVKKGSKLYKLTKKIYEENK